jgi:hypothetical protein
MYYSDGSDDFDYVAYRKYKCPECEDRDQTESHLENIAKTLSDSTLDLQSIKKDLIDLCDIYQVRIPKEKLACQKVA